MEAPLIVPWYNGLRVTVYLGNDLSRCLYVGGTYEPNEFMFLASVLREGGVFVDVGANDGLYSLFAARRVGDTGVVLALEPSAREFQRLRVNLQLNMIPNVRALMVGAGARSGTAVLKLAGFGHEGQNTLGDFAYAVAAAGSESVSVRRVDEIIGAESLDHVDVVKIDVEGSELQVLQGARDTLRRHRPLLLLELLEAALRHQGTTKEEVLDLLRSVGYRLLVFGQSGRPEPMDQIEVDGVNVIGVPRERELPNL